MCRLTSSGCLAHPKESKKKSWGMSIMENQQDHVGKPGTIYAIQNPALLCKIKRLLH